MADDDDLGCVWFGAAWLLSACGLVNCGMFRTRSTPEHLGSLGFATAMSPAMSLALPGAPEAIWGLARC